MSIEEHGAVLITGASSGIGRAAALYLAERGYRVVGTSRSMERLEDCSTRPAAGICPYRERSWTSTATAPWKA